MWYSSYMWPDCFSVQGFSCGIYKDPVLIAVGLYSQSYNYGFDFLLLVPSNG